MSGINERGNRTAKPTPQKQGQLLAKRGLCQLMPRRIALVNLFWCLNAQGILFSEKGVKILETATIRAIRQNLERVLFATEKKP